MSLVKLKRKLNLWMTGTLVDNVSINYFCCLVLPPITSR